MSKNTDIERRALPASEVRVATIDGGGTRISWYPALYNSRSALIGGSFYEEIAPGAFKKTLKEADIRALFNHNPDLVLGRNKSGTLMLRSDEKGLYAAVEVPDTRWAQDLLVSIKRKDITAASFGFQTIRDKWDYVDKIPLRTLLEVSLADVAVVTYPAYPETDGLVAVSPRALEHAGELRRSHGTAGSTTAAQRRAFLEATKPAPVPDAAQAAADRRSHLERLKRTAGDTPGPAVRTTPASRPTSTEAPRPAYRWSDPIRGFAGSVARRLRDL